MAFIVSVRPTGTLYRNSVKSYEIFCARFIESWGRGKEKVLAACKEYGCPTPQWDFDGTVLSMTMKYKKAEIEDEDKKDSYDKISNKDAILDKIVRDVSEMCPRCVQDMSEMCPR